MVAGVYACTALLDGQRASAPERVLPAASEWSHIECPMSADMWADQLSQHPDGTYCDYVVRGLREGFRIGFQYGRRSCHGASANMPTAMEHPEVVGEYLRAELRARRILGPVGWPAWSK